VLEKRKGGASSRKGEKGDLNHNTEEGGETDSPFFSRWGGGEGVPEEKPVTGKRGGITGRAQLQREHLLVTQSRGRDADGRKLLPDSPKEG